ncbi:hypothetical protein PIB30_089678 [Stylosanthes scabra]|uniref:Uncharacterized protein n=1 Tax=Stylosanthes scabra TaxID=79078 RepID=A0ABU6UTH4_9FABA|nr:hypothetical protein [Stylosanthes scabra]
MHTHHRTQGNPTKDTSISLSYILEPRISGHGNVADEDLVLMWAMVNEIKINWPYLILHHMLRLKGKDMSGGIGYLCLWTRIFNYLGIDVSNENVKHLNPQWSEVKWHLEVIRVPQLQVMKNHP